MLSDFIFWTFSLYLNFNFVFPRYFTLVIGLLLFAFTLQHEYRYNDHHHQNNALLDQLSVLIQFPGFARELNADFLLNTYPNGDLVFMSDMPASKSFILYLNYTFRIQSDRFYLDAIAFQHNTLILTYHSLKFNSRHYGVKAFYRVTHTIGGPEFKLDEVRIGNHFDNLFPSDIEGAHRIFTDFSDIPGFQEPFKIQATITKK